MFSKQNGTSSTRLTVTKEDNDYEELSEIHMFRESNMTHEMPAQ